VGGGGSYEPPEPSLVTGLLYTQESQFRKSTIEFVSIVSEPTQRPCVVCVALHTWTGNRALLVSCPIIVTVADGDG